MVKTLKIGIATVAEQRNRALAIAAGQLMPDTEEPQIWFPSVCALYRVLSDENLALLRAIRDEQPDSVEALALSVDRKAEDVLASLKTLAHYGLVQLGQAGQVIRPAVTFEHLSVDLLPQTHARHR